MKTKSFKNKAAALFTILVCGAALANPFPGKHTLEKTIRKEFKVNADALLKIQNKYGNLTLSSWDENRVVIEVHVAVQGLNEEKVQRKLDGITVEFENSSSMVSARTIFEKSNSWNFWGRSDNVQMEINYIVKLPVKNSVHLSNDYGNITLDRIDGHAKINCDYGRLNLGELRGQQNELNFDYTSKSVIRYMNSGEIKADYAGFTVERAEDLILKCDYTDAEIGKLNNLEYQCDYGNLEVQQVKNLIGKGDYISVKLGAVSGNATIDTNYGSLGIGKMGEGFEKITLHTNYTGIRIGFDGSDRFDFEITGNYTGVRGIEAFELNISKESGQSKYYRGNYGGSGSGSTLQIKSEYGDIKLEKQ